ncbi:hypothetical protein ACH4C6_28860 [Streptomyces sp. NPDC017943]|uniref:hypothetical protein n=1 Tax=Streptomyces sp. NPDC017943 TaxID=3365019 RepID=UPI0037BB2E32
MNEATVAGAPPAAESSSALRSGDVERLGDGQCVGWQLVDQARALLVAAQRELPAGRIRELHSGPAARVETLVARGRAEGVFRTDLPIA